MLVGFAFKVQMQKVYLFRIVKRGNVIIQNDCVCLFESTALISTVQNTSIASIVTFHPMKIISTKHTLP